MGESQNKPQCLVVSDIRWHKTPYQMSDTGRRLVLTSVTHLRDGTSDVSACAGAAGTGHDRREDAPHVKHWWIRRAMVIFPKATAKTKNPYSPGAKGCFGLTDNEFPDPELLRCPSSFLRPSSGARQGDFAG